MMRNSSRSYEGKKVLIVGGSAGIGRAVALDLARRGASVVVAARGRSALEETVALLREAGPGPHGFVSLDVADTASVSAACDAAIAELQGLDVLICNAGFAVCGRVDTLDEEDFVRLMDINYMGHVRVVRACLSHFSEQGSGHICLISSMLGTFGVYGYAAYSASKFAIVGFAEGLRQEMLEHDVAVSVFLPPTTRTPGLDAENEGKPAVVWQLESDNSFTKTYDADQVAGAIVRHIDSGRFEGWIGRDSWLVRRLTQWFPALTRRIADGELRRAAAKVADEPPKL